MEQVQPHDELLLEDETELAAEQPGEVAIEPAPADDDLAFQASPRASSRTANTVRGAIRMMLALAFSQYVIVTVLVAAAAVTLLRTASGFLASKFDAITQAIRHF